MKFIFDRAKSVVIITLIFLTFLLLRTTPAVPSAEPDSVIKADIAAQNNRDWQQFLALRTSREGPPESILSYQSLRKKYPEDDFMTNIISARVIGIKSLPLSVIAGVFVKVDKYLDLYGEIRAYYVGVAYQVKVEKKQIYNGVNYRLYIVVPEDGRWVIAEASEAPVFHMVTTGYGFKTQEEEAALKIQTERFRSGRFTNPEGITITKVARDYYAQPNYIRIYRVVPGKIEEADFYSYVINVLPNEWPPNWPQQNFWPAQALQAGALAVKMYGWYRVYIPKYPAQGFDVRDDSWDQVYKPDSASDSTTRAVDDVQGIGIACQDGRLFETQYWNGRTEVYNTGGRGLDIHLDAGIDTPVIARSNEGEELIVLSSGLITKDGYRWWFIKTAGYAVWTPGNYITGWVPGQFLKLKGSTSVRSIDELFVGRMSQFGTRFWAEQGVSYSGIVHYYWDNSPQTGFQELEFFQYLPNRSPLRPLNVEPADGATSVSLTPRLCASEFVDPDGDAHWKSWWEIRRAEDNVVVWDSGWRSCDLTSTAVPSGILEYNTRYKWRVRYMDSKGAWSQPLPLTTEFTTETSPPEEFISAPSAPEGASIGNTGVTYTYSTGGSFSNLNHPVQYLFDWGDGSTSGWLPAGETSACHQWNLPGTYSVKAKARCCTHTSIVSDWSEVIAVNIFPEPEFDVEPDNLNFGISESQKIFHLIVTGTGSFTWKIEAPVYNEGTGWITSVFPDQGSITGDLNETISISVQVNRAGLPSGIYTAVIPVVTSSGLHQVLVSVQIGEEGDINSDGFVDIIDVILCLRIAIGLDQLDSAVADMNRDEIVDIIDVILILRKVLGLGFICS